METAKKTNETLNCFFQIKFVLSNNIKLFDDVQ